MTRLPWDPAEIGSHEADLDEVADRLMRHASATSVGPAPDLAARVSAALDDERVPPWAWWQRVMGTGGFRGPARLMAAVAVVVAGVVGGLALGSVAELVQQGGTGTSPPIQATPSVTPSATPSPTPSPTLSPSPTTSPSPSERPSPVSSERLMTPMPEGSPRIETPEPSESDDPDEDNSGPGSGGDGSGNSGSGSGNSGPGGGGD